MSSHPSEEHTERMTLRRAPNLVAFLVTGAVLGALGGLAVGVFGPGHLEYTRGAVVGFFLVLGVVVGAAVGSIVGLVLDRVSLARTREVAADVTNGTPSASGTNGASGTDGAPGTPSASGADSASGAGRAQRPSGTE